MVSHTFRGQKPEIKAWAGLVPPGAPREVLLHASPRSSLSELRFQREAQTAGLLRAAGTLMNVRSTRFNFASRYSFLPQSVVES